MKIALIGYGKMGKTIEKIALERGHEIVSIIDVDNHEDIKGEAFASADVAIEFTAPSVALNNCLEAMEAYKIITGIGKVTVAPKILTFDLLNLGSFSLEEL